MAYRELTTLQCDKYLKLGGLNEKTGEKNPTVFEGYFLAKKTGKSNLDPNKDAYLYVFKTREGNVGINGTKSINDGMEAAVPGQMTMITFIGVKALKAGKKMNLYTINQDDTNTIAVSTPTPVQASRDEEEDSEENSNDDTTEENDYEAEEQAAKSALAAAERKANVDALLKGNKGSSTRK